MSLRLRFALCASLLLVACATAQRPASLDTHAVVRDPAAHRAFRGAAGVGADESEPPAGWWHLFEDERLDALVAQALEHNPDVRMASANLSRSLAVANEVAASRDPRFALVATAVRAQESAEAYLLTEKLPVENLADGGLRIAYQIDFAGGLRHAHEAAKEDVEASRAALHAARIHVVAAVVAAYMDSCSAVQELAIGQHVLALQRQYETATARLVAGGRVAAVELPRASGATAQSEANLPAFTARQRLAAYQIAALTGHPPADFPAALAGCQRLPRPLHALPVGNGASLLRRRPDVRQAEHGLAAASARVGVATAALYPTVTVGLSAGATGILEHFGQAQTQRWNLGPLISWSVPGGCERARVAQADAAAAAALARFDAVVLYALQDVESALAILARDLERDTALQRARDARAEAARQTAALRAAGRLAYLDAVDADQRLAAAELALATSADQVLADQIRLFLALGGGWS